MTDHPAPPRYEIKIPCDPAALSHVLAWVRLHPAHWRVTYPPRQVNNVYFDTADYECLNQNLGGVSARAKLRLRWYGPCLESIAGAQLELKHKSGVVGQKKIWPIAGALSLVDLSWNDVVRQLCLACGPEAQRWLGEFSRPVLVNHYQRAYHATTDGAVRLTVDTRLRAYDQRFSSRPNLRRPSPVADRLIVELKAFADDVSYQQLSESLAHFPLRPDRYSKYVQGVLAAPDFDGVDLP